LLIGELALSRGNRRSALLVVRSALIKLGAQETSQYSMSPTTHPNPTIRTIAELNC
jgi:hypothetical protein